MKNIKSKKRFSPNLNPKVLKALRETSGYTIEEVAKKLKTTTEKIKATEEGVALFTLTQIKKLADIYHRPLAAFFTDTPPKMPEIHIYRTNKNMEV